MEGRLGARIALSAGPGSAARWLSFGWACAAALVIAGCSGDLFHDTSWADGGAAPTGVGGASGAGGEGGASSCSPGASPLDEACAIDEERGFFVRVEGADDAAGTRAAPFATVARALEAAASAEAARRSVFVCAQTFSEHLRVPAGVALVGGLACDEDGWPLAAGEMTRLQGEADAIPMRLEPGGAETRVERFHVVAADAEVPGGSSIAAMAIGVPVLFRECRLEAGRGADGEAGEPGDAVSAAPPGLPGQAACGRGVGGEPGAGACEGDGVDPSGGRGGQGTPQSQPAGDGADGLPTGATGGGGEGQPTGLGWSCNDEGQGEDGGPGADGDAGRAATGEDRGELDDAGFTAASGVSGNEGRPGQGGGGGGASRGGMVSCVGAGGGGGGAGGCGGPGGGGGRGGGASFAIAAVDAPIRVVDSALSIGAPGRGGAGGAGAPGGAGGEGGPGGAEGTTTSTSAGCSGGDGGTGGAGGPGGGGRGGHAVGVAWSGEAPTLESSSVDRPEAGGAGGVSPEGADGADGAADDLLELP